MELFLLGLLGLWQDFGVVFAVELAMLCLLMVAGLYVVYTDLRFRDIPNVVVWIVLAGGMMGQCVLWRLGVAQGWQLLLVTGGGFVVSYLLFLYGFWAPGDAKLFWAMAVGFPPTLCYAPALGSLNSPVWALLINAVLLNFAVLLVFAVVQYRRLPSAQAGRDAGNPGRYAQLALDTAALTGLVTGGGSLLLGQTLHFASSAIAVVVGYMAWDRLTPAARPARGATASRHANCDSDGWSRRDHRPTGRHLAPRPLRSWATAAPTPELSAFLASLMRSSCLRTGQVRDLRRKLSQQKQQISQLERGLMASTRKKPSVADTGEDPRERRPRARVTPSAIKAERSRLHISQRKMVDWGEC